MCTFVRIVRFLGSESQKGEIILDIIPILGSRIGIRKRDCFMEMRTMSLRRRNRKRRNELTLSQYLVEYIRNRNTAAMNIVKRDPVSDIVILI